MTLSELEDVGDCWTLELCVESPVDPVVRELGFVPTGYFWDSLLGYAAPELTGAVESDSEMAAYVAFGDRAALLAVQQVLEPLLVDPDRLRSLVARAGRDHHPLED